MTINFAVAVDLEIFGEELGVCCLVIIESVGVFGPRRHFKVHTISFCTYNGGFTISLFMGFMNLFIPPIFLLPDSIKCST